MATLQDKHSTTAAGCAGMLCCSDDNCSDDLIGTYTDAEYLQVFEPHMVVQGFSQLSRTAPGHGAAYLQLNLNGTTLDDAAAVTHCQHLQVLNISGNCLTSLRALGQLHHLISLDASHNQLTQVLGLALNSSTSSTSSCRSNTDAAAAAAAAAGAGSNLRSADLSFNRISQIRADLSGFKMLSRLVLDGNQLEFVGGGLRQLRRLSHLSLSGNRICSVRGLEGLTSLRELHLDGNRLASLVPLSGLTGLEVLQAAHNQLTSCDGVQGLSSLRRLDLSGNLLRRLEELCACRQLWLLRELDVAANPLEAAQNTRLCLIMLLPQVGCLNGAPVSSTEKVDAANMAGAAAGDLLAIRKQYFPSGELDDGGGAVPPTAAGLIPSRAEEERSCSDPEAMFAAVDAWAQAVPVTAALPPGEAATASSDPRPDSRRSSCCGSTAATADESGRGGICCPISAVSRVAAGRPERLSGLAAVAARLAVGCSKDVPWAQLQLVRACYCWVVSHVRRPRGCDVAAGADVVTWDVGRHLFGEDEQQQQLHRVLLPNNSGTFAECVSGLLVGLIKSCHLEAVQLSGFWKAGGQTSVAPGSRLGCHNHSWVAVKVNGRWRLLDPVYHIIHDGQLPFFLPPEALIASHLPFESYFQLLEQPLSQEEWWQRPEVSLAFSAVGGQLLDQQLLDQQLKSCTVMPPTFEGQVLPCLKIPVAAPATDRRYVRLKLLDSNLQPLAQWQQHRSSQAHCGSCSSRPCCQHSDQAAADSAQPCLVYQQQVLSAAGHREAVVTEQELWVALPGPGCFHVAVEMVVETPGVMQLAVKGLPDPLSITLRQQEDVIRLKVVVPPVLTHDPADGVCVDPNTRVAALPQLLSPGAATGCLQLLRPAPGQPLEADQPELFEVLAPGAAAVAIGCEELGWTELTRAAVCTAASSPAGGSGGSRGGSAGGTGLSAVKRAKAAAAQQALFSGVVVMPRLARCLVAVKCLEAATAAAPIAGLSRTRGSSQGEAEPWMPVLGLVVQKQVQHIVAVPDPAPLPEPDPSDPGLPRVRRLLAALDIDGDGLVSRRDMLTAFRRDRQLADLLKIPPRIKAGDGTLDRFFSRFQAINRDGLGFIDLKQLWACIGEQVAASSRLSTAASTAAGGDAGSKGRQTSARSTASHYSSHYSAHSSRPAAGTHRSSVATSAGAGSRAAAESTASRRLSLATAVTAAD